MTRMVQSSGLFGFSVNIITLPQMGKALTMGRQCEWWLRAYGLDSDRAGFKFCLHRVEELCILGQLPNLSIDSCFLPTTDVDTTCFMGLLQEF